LILVEADYRRRQVQDRPEYGFTPIGKNVCLLDSVARIAVLGFVRLRVWTSKDRLLLAYFTETSGLMQS
jgi:hypothetical protein